MTRRLAPILALPAVFAALVVLRSCGGVMLETPAFAQSGGCNNVSGQQIRCVTADPTGQACSPQAIALQTPVGKIYTCDATGHYALVSGGGGGAGATGATGATGPVGAWGVVNYYTANHTQDATDCGNAMSFSGSSLTATFPNPSVSGCPSAVINADASSTLAISLSGASFNGTASNPAAIPACTAPNCSGKQIWPDQVGNYVGYSPAAGGGGGTVTDVQDRLCGADSNGAAWIPGVNIEGLTTAVTGRNNDYCYYDVPILGNPYVVVAHRLSATQTGALNLTMLTTNTQGLTGTNISFIASHSCVSLGGSLPPSYANTQTMTFPVAASGVMTATTWSVDLTGCSPGQMIFIKVMRDSTSAYSLIYELMGFTLSETHQ